MDSPTQALTEFSLIDRYFAAPALARLARAKREGVKLGIGDDCALLAPRAGYELAVSSDMLIEGRHFLPTVDPMHLGHKALAVNLSDLAACGATPLGFTLAMALPEARADWLAAISHGLFALADQHHIALIGGDTTKSVQPDRVSAGPICLCITVIGELPQGTALLRSGAKAGDDIYVSGTLGDARLALGQCLNEWHLSDECFAHTRPRMEQPIPRVALGEALRGIATSAIDVSDGFLGDLAHILKQSKVGAEIYADDLPRSDWLSKETITRQRLCTLNGGDDYELVFTAPKDKAQAVQEAARHSNTTIKKMGKIQQDMALTLLDAQGKVFTTNFQSFDHFAANPA